MLATFGFGVLAFMFVAYVLLDGYDLGIGAISPFVTTSPRERAALLHAIGPFWNGNEVWLIAGGATLFGLFPEAYAVAFSGFYLPFMAVLWLLMFRGLAIELRETVDSDVWRTFWDALFAFSSALLAILFGVALGNLVRGVDLQRSGFFFGTFSMLLNPFALGVGLFALAALGLHGLLYAAMRIEGSLADRCTAFARRVWWAVLVLFVAVTAAAFAIDRGGDLRLALSGLLTLASLGALAVLRRSLARPRRAFVASSAFLALVMIAAATTLFPYLVPNYPRGTGGLTVYAAGPGSSAALATLLGVVVVALIALLVYRTLVAARVTHPVHVPPP